MRVERSTNSRGFRPPQQPEVQRPPRFIEPASAGFGLRPSPPAGQWQSSGLQIPRASRSSSSWRSTHTSLSQVQNSLSTPTTSCSSSTHPSSFGQRFHCLLNNRLLLLLYLLLLTLMLLSNDAFPFKKLILGVVLGPNNLPSDSIASQHLGASRMPNSASDRLQSAAAALTSYTRNQPAAAACDFSRGKWVYDPANYPLWTHGACSMVEPGLVCAKLGRPDDDFTKYSWQPDDCELERFSPSEMRQLLVGKRVVFVGDSLARNQVGSLLCLLSRHLPERAITDPSLPSVHEINGRSMSRDMKSIVVEFVDFNFTVEYHLSHFIVSDHRPARRSPKKVRGVINTDAIHSRVATSLLKAHWSRGRPLMVIFTMGHWFNPGKTLHKHLHYLSNGQVDMKMNDADGFRLSVRTVAKWTESWMRPDDMVVFRSYAPTHFMEGTWNKGGKCPDKHPVTNVSQLVARSWVDPLIIYHDILQEELAQSKARVLDVTYLSLLRPDAHIADYMKPRGRDCSHWCLPGVPDIWNLVLLNMIALEGKTP